MTHPAIKPGNAAIITGAASGIGLAAAKKFAAAGMGPIHMIDHDKAALDLARRDLERLSGGAVVAWPADVSDLNALTEINEAIVDEDDSVGVLMNNAGAAPGGGPLDNYDGWRRVLGVNLWGVIHGVQAFAPAMIAQGIPAAIINTGSKQGITAPPGDTAYNVSKAGVKILTESLAHLLLNTNDCQVTAHLLIPGFVWTGMTRGARAEKPAGAWTPEETVDFMLKGLCAGDFYILCPDNNVTAEVDRKRIAWAAGDLIENRPALSRWHPDYKAAFDAFMAGD